jgi:hypothetical protein
MRTSMSRMAWTIMAMAGIAVSSGCKGGLGSVGFMKPNKPPTQLSGSGLPSPSSTVSPTNVNADPYGQASTSYDQGGSANNWNQTPTVEYGGASGRTADNRGGYGTSGAGATGAGYMPDSGPSTGYNSTAAGYTAPAQSQPDYGQNAGYGQGYNTTPAAPPSSYGGPTTSGPTGYAAQNQQTPNQQSAGGYGQNEPVAPSAYTPQGYQDRATSSAIPSQPSAGFNDYNSPVPNYGTGSGATESYPTTGNQYTPGTTSRDTGINFGTPSSTVPGGVAYPPTTPTAGYGPASTYNTSPSYSGADYGTSSPSTAPADSYNTGGSGSRAYQQ